MGPMYIEILYISSHMVTLFIETPYTLPNLKYTMSLEKNVSE